MLHSSDSWPPLGLIYEKKKSLFAPNEPSASDMDTWLALSPFRLNYKMVDIWCWCDRRLSCCLSMSDTARPPWPPGRSRHGGFLRCIGDTLESEPPCWVWPRRWPLASPVSGRRPVSAAEGVTVSVQRWIYFQSGGCALLIPFVSV